MVSWTAGTLTGLTCGTGGTLISIASDETCNYNTVYQGQPTSEPKERKAVSHYLKKAIMRKR